MSGVLIAEDVFVEDCSPSGGVIAVWTLNRPEKLNALNLQSHQAIKAQCARVEADDNVRCVVVRGAPPPEPPEGKRKKPAAFAAGADISEFVGKTSDDVRLFFEDNAWEAIWDLSKPTIAMVDGFALGGRVVDDPVFRRRAGVDKGVEARGEAGFDEVAGGGDICSDHSRQVGLLRVGAIRGQMEGPFGSDKVYGAGEALGVVQVDFVYLCLVAIRLQAPARILRAEQQVNLVPFGEQTAGEVGADESAGSGNDGALHVGSLRATSRRLPKGRVRRMRPKVVLSSAASRVFLPTAGKGSSRAR